VENVKMAENAGLYQKFDVRRRDGRDQAGGDREAAAYFVLDVAHDPHALAALTAYRMSCEWHLPALANDLRALEDELRAGRRDGPALARLRRRA
jgi:hypothetical protein